MVLIEKEVNVKTWDAAGFFRLLSCWDEDELDMYTSFRDSLQGVTPVDFEITQQNDLMGVYILYFHRSGYFYIGSSTSLAKRVNTHRSTLRNYRHPNKKMSRAFQQNQDRTPEVLFMVTFGENQARTIEQKLIDLVFFDRYCLNQSRMVEEYRPPTEETLERKRQAARRQWGNPDFKIRIQEINKRPEVKARRIANSNRNAEDPAYREKISTASKRIWKDENYIASHRQSSVAVWKDEGFRERHRNSMRSHWDDPEFRARRHRSLMASVESRRISVTINGVKYTDVKAAADALGVSHSTIRRRGIFDR